MSLPGTALKVLALLWVLLNVKVWPLHFHLRFWKICGQNFYLRRRVKPKSVYEVAHYHTYCPLMEMDFNLHKSNSTYFSDMDMARSKVMAHVFKDFFLNYKDETVKMAKHQWVYTPLGSVQMVFRKEIKPYTMYDVESKVFGWTNKWLYVICEFKQHGQVHAFGLSKYVFKQQRKTVPPESAIKFCGLLTEEAVLKNSKLQHIMQEALDLEKIDTMIE